MDLRTAILASATLAFTALAGCLGGGEVDEVRLGVLVPLTGGLAAFGPSGLKAVQLCAAQFNDAGGVLDGAEIRVVQGDSQTDAAKAPTEMNRLVNVEEVHAVIGAYSSGVTLSVWETAKDNGIPLVTPASTSPTLTGLRDDDLVFRVPPSDAFQGKVMASLVMEDGFDRIATLAINNDYGTGFAGVMREKFEADGGQVLEEVFYDPQGSVFNSEVDTVADADPEAVVVIGYPDTVAVIVRAAHQRGLLDDFEWYFSEGVFDAAFVRDSGRDAGGNHIVAGVKGTTPQTLTPEGLPTAQDFREQYEEEHGEAPALFAAEAYDACVTLLLAMEHAGGVDGHEVAQSLREVANPPGRAVSDPLQALAMVQDGDDIDYNGASGAIDWDENGDPAIGQYAIWQVNAEGGFDILDEGIVVE